jgi:uncharacterized protein
VWQCPRGTAINYARGAVASRDRFFDCRANSQSDRNLVYLDCFSRSTGNRGFAGGSTQTDLKPILQPAIALGTIRAEPKVSTGYSLLDGGDFMLGGAGAAPLKITQDLLQPPKRSLRANINLVLDNVIQELRELGGVLVLGSAVAAAIQTLTPRELIVSLGQGPILSIVVMMILAGSISICSTVDAFFALSFAATFTSGSLLAFLVFGPMFDLKSIGLMLSIFKPKAIFYLFAIATQLTFLLTLLVNFHVS